MSKDLLFFIAVLPGEEIREEITHFKKYALEHFQSGHALKSPPHITLIPPFRWMPGRLVELKQTLEQFVRTCVPFYLTLNNFDCFRPRVIFIDLEKSEALIRLQTRLQEHLAMKISLEMERNHGFHPHMTVAFKDLKRSVFPLAWEYFSVIQYTRIFEVKQLFLLQHDSRQWRVNSIFPFQT